MGESTQIIARKKRLVDSRAYLAEARTWIVSAAEATSTSEREKYLWACINAMVNSIEMLTEMEEHDGAEANG